MSQWLIEPRSEATLERFEPVARWSQVQLVERYLMTGRWAVTGSYDDLSSLRLAGRGVVISADGVPAMSGRVTSIDVSSNSTTVSGTNDFDVFDARRVYPVPGANWGAQTTSAYDVRTGDAETVLLDYIKVNAGSTAYAGNGTYSDRRTTGLTVPTSLARGASVKHSGRFGKLSWLVANVGEAGGLAVDVIHDELTGTPRLLVTVDVVADRRDEIRFGTPDVLANGLIKDDWKYTITAPTITDALVAGGGAGTSRSNAYAHDTGAISLWDRVIEEFIDQRQTTDATELANSAADALAANNEPVQVSFTVIALDPDLVFGMGDLVSVNLRGVDLSNRVRERTRTISVGNNAPTEQVEVVVGSRDASAWVTVSQKKLLNALRRLDLLEAQ